MRHDIGVLGRSVASGILKSVAAWLFILCLAILNGALREAVLMPALGKPFAFVVSGFLLSGAILVVAYLLAGFLRNARSGQLLGVGLLWFCLTLAFEFGVGRFVQHQSWNELFEAYTFKDGNIWPLVLVVTLLAPLVAFRIRHRR